MTAGLLAEWSQWMNACGMSARTITDRVQLIGRFEDDAGAPSVALGWQAVADFLASKRTAGTRQTYYAHLRCWFAWLVRFGYRVDNPTTMLQPPRGPRRIPHPVTIGQLTLMLQTRMHHRTRAMILLGAYEGFRVSEIAKVAGEDLTADTIHVIGKGNVEAWLPLHQLVAEIAATMPRQGWWFPSHVNLGRPITGNSVSTIIGDVMRRAGVPHTAHALRHFFGTETLRSSGGNLVVTKELMRHANIASTALYTEVDDQARRAAVDALPVPAVAA
jgi:integrase/recombinase XerD